jgi:hypothetical protein
MIRLSHTIVICFLKKRLRNQKRFIVSEIKTFWFMPAVCNMFLEKVNKRMFWPFINPVHSNIIALEPLDLYLATMLIQACKWPLLIVRLEGFMSGSQLPSIQTLCQANYLSIWFFLLSSSLNECMLTVHEYYNVQEKRIIIS